MGDGLKRWLRTLQHLGCQQEPLRIYFAGGAYCQISSAGEAALAAELLGRLGAKR